MCRITEEVAEIILTLFDHSKITIKRFRKKKVFIIYRYQNHADPEQLYKQFLEEFAQKLGRPLKEDEKNFLKWLSDKVVAESPDTT